MLGSIASKGLWHWVASGKHPVAGDYFSLGKNTPMLNAFTKWVEKGYQTLGSRPGHSSWRFWAKGSGKETLACGVARDSSDSLGRPYPLMILGTGPLEGWEDQWDLLPFVCEKTWRQIEYLFTRVFKDLGELGDDVRTIKQPYPRWSEYIAQREGLVRDASAVLNGSSSLDLIAVEERAVLLSKEREFYIALDGGSLNDPFSLAATWHYFLKESAHEVPNAVFMGGALEESYMAVFRRPLTPADFVKLWSTTEYSR